MENRIIELDDLTNENNKKYLEDLLRDLFIEVNSVVTGTYEGTGSDVSVALGWRPIFLEVFFVDGGGTSIWVHDDADPNCNYHGDAGAAGADYDIDITDTGFTATGAQVVASGETFFYRAIQTRSIADTI